MSDGDDVLVGTPTIGDVLVNVTVVDHIKGPKIDRFKYRPKKRIRVRGGHRQQFTRLLIDFIGRPDEERERKVEKTEPAPVVEKEAVAEQAPKAKRQSKAKAQEQAPTSAKKASATTKSSSKKTDAKKK